MKKRFAIILTAAALSMPEFNSAGLLMAYMPAKNELDP